MTSYLVIGTKSHFECLLSILGVASDFLRQVQPQWLIGNSLVPCVTLKRRFGLLCVMVNRRVLTVLTDPVTMISSMIVQQLLKHRPIWPYNASCKSSARSNTKECYVPMAASSMLSYQDVVRYRNLRNMENDAIAR